MAACFDPPAGDRSVCPPGAATTHRPPQSPVAIIDVSGERMVGPGIASSLNHEVGHQGAARLTTCSHTPSRLARGSNSRRAKATCSGVQMTDHSTKATNNAMNTAVQIVPAAESPRFAETMTEMITVVTLRNPRSRMATVGDLPSCRAETMSALRVWEFATLPLAVLRRFGLSRDTALRGLAAL